MSEANTLATDERVQQLEEVVVDLAYQVYLLTWAVQSVAGTQARDDMQSFFSAVKSRLQLPQESDHDRPE